MVVMILLALIFLLEMVGLEIEPAATSGTGRKKKPGLSSCKQVAVFSSSSSTHPYLSLRWVKHLSQCSQQLGRIGAQAALLLTRRRCPGCWSPSADVGDAATCTGCPRSTNWTWSSLSLYKYTFIHDYRISQTPNWTCTLWPGSWFCFLCPLCVVDLRAEQENFRRHMRRKKREKNTQTKAKRQAMEGISSVWQYMHSIQESAANAKKQQKIEKTTK